MQLYIMSDKSVWPLTAMPIEILEGAYLSCYDQGWAPISVHVWYVSGRVESCVKWPCTHQQVDLPMVEVMKPDVCARSWRLRNDCDETDTT